MIRGHQLQGNNHRPLLPAKYLECHHGWWVIPPHVTGGINLPFERGFAGEGVGRIPQSSFPPPIVPRAPPSSIAGHRNFTCGCRLSTVGIARKKLSLRTYALNPRGLITVSISPWTHLGRRYPFECRQRWARQSMASAQQIPIPAPGAGHGYNLRGGRSALQGQTRIATS
jgi:hypothetical protein